MLAVYLTPIFAKTILQFHCQILSPSLQRGSSKDAAKIPTCLIACLSDEAIGVVETKPQALLHGVIKKGLVGWPRSLDQPLQHLSAKTDV